jgi:hypothetical protein
MEHEAEYRKLVASGSDYDELLRMGHVSRRVDDRDAWRKEIKTKARADRIRVRTGLSARDASVAWAFLKHLDDRTAGDDELHDAARHLSAVMEAFARAGLQGHERCRVIRAEGRRAAAICLACGARLYVDWNPDPPFVEGEVFEVNCSRAVELQD